LVFGSVGKGGTTKVEASRAEAQGDQVGDAPVTGARHLGRRRDSAIEAEEKTDIAVTARRNLVVGCSQFACRRTRRRDGRPGVAEIAGA